MQVLLPIGAKRYCCCFLYVNNESEIRLFPALIVLENFVNAQDDTTHQNANKVYGKCCGWLLE